MTPFTDISRFVTRDKTDEVVTLCERRSYYVCCTFHDYYVGHTDAGETVAVYAGHSSTLFNCLSLSRLNLRPRFRLLDVSDEPIGRQTALPAALGVRAIYFRDVEFACAERRRACEIAHRSLSTGAWFDAILRGGEDLARLLERTSA